VVHWSDPATAESASAPHDPAAASAAVQLEYRQPDEPKLKTRQPDDFRHWSAHSVTLMASPDAGNSVL
jgi:hypothetical protein